VPTLIKYTKTGGEKPRGFVQVGALDLAGVAVAWPLVVVRGLTRGLVLLFSNVAMLRTSCWV